MSLYRLWQVRHGDVVTGPFPEPLICQQILIGRIGENDLISLDGHAWHSYREFPELCEETARLVDPHPESHDALWHEERVRAARRFYDERKSPDRRDLDHEVSRDTGKDRRTIPESVDQHTYRHHLAEVDGALRNSRLHYGWSAFALLAGLLLVGTALYYNRGVVPIDIGLAQPGMCEAEAGRGVDWHSCDKSGFLLAGADLREADLSGANLAGANLSYANLTGARLEGARLQGAILAGTVWSDGRRCSDDSVGSCRSAGD